MGSRRSRVCEAAAALTTRHLINLVGFFFSGRGGGHERRINDKRKCKWLSYVFLIVFFLPFIFWSYFRFFSLSFPFPFVSIPYHLSVVLPHYSCSLSSLVGHFSSDFLIFYSSFHLRFSSLHNFVSLLSTYSAPLTPPNLLLTLLFFFSLSPPTLLLFLLFFSPPLLAPLVAQGRSSHSPLKSYNEPHLYSNLP